MVALISALFTFGCAMMMLANAQPQKREAEAENPCTKARERGDRESCASPAPGLRFFFDHATVHCQPFLYDGCGGNENRFANLAECRKACLGTENVIEHGSLPHGATAPVLPVPKCDGGVRAAVRATDSTVFKCASSSADKCPTGFGCNTSLDACCPTSKESVCLIQYDTGHYVRAGSHTPRYFYNPTVKNCQLFTYYGALGNSNNFETYTDCIKYCRGL